MNRRELLKFSLLSPLLGLFKRKPKRQRKVFWKHTCGGGTTEVPNTCVYPYPSNSCKNCIMKSTCNSLRSKFSKELFPPTTGTSSKGKHYFRVYKGGKCIDKFIV